VLRYNTTLNRLDCLLIAIEEGFPTWDTYTPRGTFDYLKGYISRLAIESKIYYIKL